jgi:hypothetical protein
VVSDKDTGNKDAIDGNGACGNDNGDVSNECPQSQHPGCKKAPPNAPNDSAKPKPEQKDWLEYATVIAAFGAIIAAGVGAWQGHIANKTYAVISDQEHRQLRAYIVVDTDADDAHPKIKFNPPVTATFAGAFLEADVILKNGGLTPAFDVEIWGSTLVAAASVIDETPPLNELVRVRGASVKGPGTVISFSKGYTISQMDWERLAKNTGTYLSFGTVAYKDAFGCRHFVNWCVWSSVTNPRGGFCAAFNDADQGQECSSKSLDWLPNNN